MNSKTLLSTTERALSKEQKRVQSYNKILKTKDIVLNKENIKGKAVLEFWDQLDKVIAMQMVVNFLKKQQ